MHGRRTHRKMIELKTILCKLLLISCRRRELPEAALAASLFHYKELEIEEVKKYLHDKGVSVRLWQ